MYSDTSFLLSLIEIHTRLLRTCLLYSINGKNDQLTKMAGDIVKKSPAELGGLLSWMAANLDKIDANTEGPVYYYD